MRMLKNFSENFNKEIRNIMETENTKNPSEMKNAITERKNTLQGINSRVDEVENQIRDLEDKEAENIQSQQQKEK